jgi:hypothetical protein
MIRRKEVRDASLKTKEPSQRTAPREFEEVRDAAPAARTPSNNKAVPLGTALLDRASRPRPSLGDFLSPRYGPRLGAFARIPARSSALPRGAPQRSGSAKPTSAMPH